MPKAKKDNGKTESKKVEKTNKTSKTSKSNKTSKSKIKKDENVVTAIEATVEIEETKDEKMDIVQKIEQAQETKVLKTSKRIFDDEDMIPVASLKAGRVIFNNPHPPYDYIVWENFFDVEYVRYGTLSQIKRKGGQPFKTSLYVVDKDVQKALNIERFYKGLGNLNEIANILELDLNRALEIIEKSDEKTKNIIREVLSNKIANKEKIDFFKLKAIAEKINMELNL